jgi:hypothetical protein
MKKGQQEIIGFVLIVTIVIIAALVFLVISLKNKNPELNNVEAENMLASIKKLTTGCTVNPPTYENVEELVLSCNRALMCSNLNKKACTYLSEYLTEVFKDLKETDGTMAAYELQIYVKQISSTSTRPSEPLIPKIYEGSCNNTDLTMGSQNNIKATSAENIVLKLLLCFKR